MRTPPTAQLCPQRLGMRTLSASDCPRPRKGDFGERLHGIPHVPLSPREGRINAGAAAVRGLRPYSVSQDRRICGFASVEDKASAARQVAYVLVLQSDFHSMSGDFLVNSLWVVAHDVLGPC